MELNMLTAVSPIDGRYRGKTKALAAYFSEYALIRYRVRVEIEYLIALVHLPLPQLKGFPVERRALVAHLGDDAVRLGGLVKLVELPAREGYRDCYKP